MSKIIMAMAAGIMLLIITGCTTTGKFNVPKGSELYIYDRPDPVKVDADGMVTTKPFFWTAAGIPPSSGIPYKLEQDGKVIKQGRLRTKFRVVSIFWPPLAAIYWPMGFNDNVYYDLVTGTQNNIVPPKSAKK